MRINNLIKLIIIICLMGAGWVGKVDLEWAFGSVILLMFLF